MLVDLVKHYFYIWLIRLLPISYIICIWINSHRFGWHPPAPTSGFVECPRIVIKQQNNGLCLHFDFWKVSGFFENSNGKWTNNPLFGWQPVHWLSESQCTHRVNALFTRVVNTLFTQQVEALFTQVVEAPFTQAVKALFTQEVHAFRGKMTMKIPWNKPWFFAVFQNITRSRRKKRKNKASEKSRMSEKQKFFLLFANNKRYAPSRSL